MRIPCPKHSSPGAASNYPNIIEPEGDDPSLHRYPLRSQQVQALSVKECNAVIDQVTTSAQTYSWVASTQGLQANAIVQTVQHASTSEFKCNAVIDETTVVSQEYRHLMRTPAKKVWETSLANDLGRLAQGVETRTRKGNSTIRFVANQAVPRHKKVTYARLVAELGPHKKEVHRVRVTVGGDRLDYTGITATQTASLITTKCLINSTLSTDSAKFMSVDIKDY